MIAFFQKWQPLVHSALSCLAIQHVLCKPSFEIKICTSYYMDLSKLLHVSVKIVTWICQSCYMDLSKLLHGSFQIVIWICQNCYIDLPKLLHGSVKVVALIFMKIPFFFTAPIFSSQGINIVMVSVAAVVISTNGDHYE